MTSLVIWQRLLLLYMLTCHCSAFNLDTKYPKVLKHEANSYFGYSVAFWNGPNGYKVLVGSPKAKSRNLVTGGLFKCDIKTGFCKIINVGQISTDPWLGVSLDVSPMNQSLITVCGHRAKSFHQKMEMVSGVCYQLKNKKLTKMQLKPHNDLFGISVQYAKRSHILLIGVPGLSAFTGGYYVEYFYGSDEKILKNEKYSYTGYCVAILNNRSAIGMPRYQQYGGVIYERQVITFKSKYAFGSYFGSALAAVDLNNDGKEDLVVGAPYYSEKFVEEGRVYIFFFSVHRLKSTASIILSAPSYRGQFGKTLASGDFNNDRYSDVIVAAPYENDGSGTIYLFSGHRFGLHKTFSQKIQGKDFKQNILSFGISFSRTADIDVNGYQDIAVGAYLSDKVFVFYGRPIVQIKGSLKAEPKILSLCTNCWQDNEPVSTSLQVEINLGKIYLMLFNIHFNTDTNRKPAAKRTLIKNDQKEFMEFMDTVEITQFFRKKFVVIIKNTVDILEPINFTFTYHLKDQGYSPGCNSTCPIAKNGSFSTLVKFDIGCGADDTCNTYLKVSMREKVSQLILGRDQKFVLLAQVESIGEHAYGAKARIFYSQFLEFESVNQTSDSDVQCHQEKDQELTCFLGHPLKGNSSVLFEVIFFINMTTKEKSIHLMMNATTISNVSDEYVNNTQKLTVPIYLESKLEVTGFSFPESNVFRSSPSKVMNMLHQYELRNNGPSDALAVRFHVLIPQAIFKDISLLIFRKVQVKRDDGKIFSNTCHSKSYAGTNEDFKATIQHLRHNGNVFNCSGFKCRNLSCELDQIQKNEPVIRIQIYFDIHIELLKFFQGQIRSIHIVTTSTLTQLHSDRLKVVHFDHAKAKSTIIITRLPAKLKWWVVICSVAVGLLTLLIFSILLWHCGYFQRVRVNKRQLKEERAAEECSLFEHEADSRPHQKIYTRQKISESEGLPEIE